MDSVEVLKINNYFALLNIVGNNNKHYIIVVAIFAIDLGKAIVYMHQISRKTLGRFI